MALLGALSIFFSPPRSSLPIYSQGINFQAWDFSFLFRFSDERLQLEVIVMNISCYLVAAQLQPLLRNSPVIILCRTAVKTLGEWIFIYFFFYLEERRRWKWAVQRWAVSCCGHTGLALLNLQKPKDFHPGSALSNEFPVEGSVKCGFLSSKCSE